jgi:hypothetical protein
MTKDDIILIKELIKEAVGSVIKEAVRDAVESNMKKDLKEVKLLLAKVIKEGRAYSAPMVEQSMTPEERDQLRKSLREHVGEDFRTMIHDTSNKVMPTMPMMSPEAAQNLSVNGTLPDFDAPIPMINKNSVVYKEMKERVSE